MFVKTVILEKESLWKSVWPTHTAHTLGEADPPSLPQRHPRGPRGDALSVRCRGQRAGCAQGAAAGPAARGGAG